MAARQGPKAELTVQQDQFVRMEANGLSSPDIIKALWNVSPGDETYHAYECKLSRWRKHPKYEQVWKEEVRKQDYMDYTNARKVLRKSMNNEKDGWLAMQSAVNVMNSSGKRIYADEDSAVTVRIEGMPDLGTPDQDE